jgi:hypothetical protein
VVRGIEKNLVLGSEDKIDCNQPIKKTPFPSSQATVSNPVLKGFKNLSYQVFQKLKRKKRKKT